MAFTSEYMVEIEEAQKLERELEEARKQRDKWKANHDNQVAINRTLRDRPDLGERAKLVDALTKQRDALAEALERLKKLPEKWRNECGGNWLRGGVVLQLAHDFEVATKGGDV